MTAARPHTTQMRTAARVCNYAVHDTASSRQLCSNLDYYKLLVTTMYTDSSIFSTLDMRYRGAWGFHSLFIREDAATLMSHSCNTSTGCSLGNRINLFQELTRIFFSPGYSIFLHSISAVFCIIWFYLFTLQYCVKQIKKKYTN